MAATDVETLGPRIRRMRKERGWSQGELGERAGTSQAQISKYEKEIATPAAPTLRRLATALGVTLDDLLPEA